MINVNPSNPRGIVWLASYPRSGSSWVRAFLSNLVAVQSGLPAATDLTGISAFTLEESLARPYEPILGRPAIEAEPAAIAAARPKVHHALVNEAKGLLLLKTHSANIQAFGVPVVTPEVTAGAIYIVRNPLDVAISFAAFNGLSVDDAIAKIGTSGLSTPTTADRIFTLAGSWSENVATWTAAEHPLLIVVRYEDLYADTDETFASIARHVRMQFTADQLAEATDRSSFERLQKLEADKGFAERPPTADRFFRAGRPDQWREALTNEQVDRVVAAHGEQMDRFGYLP